MSVGALFLHNLRSGTCPGWIITGGTEKDKKSIDLTLIKYINYEQDAGFNEWYFSTYVFGHWYVKRFTWDAGFSGTLDEVLEKVENYYEKRNE